MVAAKYEEFFAAGYVPFPELNENRRKMARLPAGAEPLVNPIGGAPGVLCRSGETRILSLPGVPGELKAIVDESLGPLVAEVFGAARYEERSLEVELQDESAIADILRAAEEQHPSVYVKSRAKVLGSTRVIRVTLSGRGEDDAAVAALLAPAADQLLAQIAAAGFAVRPAPRKTRPARTTDAPARDQAMKATPPARVLARSVDFARQVLGTDRTGRRLGARGVRLRAARDGRVDDRRRRRGRRARDRVAGRLHALTRRPCPRRPLLFFLAARPGARRARPCAAPRRSPRRGDGTRPRTSRRSSRGRTR